MSEHIRLGLDASIGAACLCLCKGEQSFTIQASSSRSHSKELLPLCEQLLQQANCQWSDLTAFVVATGPGSFTGLRIVCATVSGLQSRLQLPLYRLSALAISAAQCSSKESFWVLEDARAGECFAAQYQQGCVLNAAHCRSFDSLNSLSEKRYVSIQGMPDLGADWQALSIDKNRCTALAELCQQADQQQASPYPMPNYLQLSQAERNAPNAA